MCYSIYLNQKINFLHFVDVQNETKTNRNENQNKSSNHQKNVKN